MRKIQFLAAYGDESKIVEIAQIFGSGGSWHVYADNYYLGSIVEINGIPKFLPQHPDQYETADFDIISEMVRT